MIGQARLIALHRCLTAALIVSACASPLAAAAPLGQGQAPEIPVARLVFGLVLCVGLAWGIAYLIRTFRLQGRLAPLKLGGIGQARLRVLEARRAGLATDVCLVRCDGRDFLIAATQGHVLVLHSSDVPPAPTEPA